jgi:hypothetical protein
MYYNALWDDRAPSDGGGNFGLPGESDNGTGLNGVYYDWESRTYRSTLLGYREVGWEYAYKHSVLPALRQQEQERQLEQLANLHYQPQNNSDGLLAMVGDPPGVTNIWYNTLLGANSKFIPLATGQDLFKYGYGGYLNGGIVFTSDAKFGLYLGLDAKIASVEGTTYFSLMDETTSTKLDFSLPGPIEAPSSLWIGPLNVTEASKMYIDFAKYCNFVTKEFIYNVTHPQKLYGF